MVTPYEAHMTGAVMAREIAKQCLDEAKTAETDRAFRLIAEHDRHIERAEWHEQHAAMFAPKHEQKDMAA